jgi:SAM-dependent methyltransferase
VSFPPLSFNAWLRWDLVERILERLPEIRSVLEIGPGEGSLAARLASRFEYVGVEPDRQACTKAQRRLARIGRGTIVCGDASSLERERTFDLICAFEVLEHIEDDVAALRDWSGLLRDQGFVLVSVPANPARWGPADRKVGHYRRYERDGLASLLLETGFKDPEIWTYGFPLGYLLEAARNTLSRGGQTAAPLSARTAASGRYLQPPEYLGWATRTATAPFRVLQRPFFGSSLGTGLVGLARRATRTP